MKYAPAREDRLMAYVVSERSPLVAQGRPYEWINWARSLADAKGRYGWTRQMHTRRSVRRATVEDLATLSDRGTER